MRRSSFPGRHSSAPLRQRIERAAAEMNAYLIVLAIGLAALNLTCLAMLAAQHGVTRHSEIPAATTEIGAIPAPAIGVATGGWSGTQPAIRSKPLGGLRCAPPALHRRAALRGTCTASGIRGFVE